MSTARDHASSCLVASCRCFNQSQRHPDEAEDAASEASTCAHRAVRGRPLAAGAVREKHAGRTPESKDSTREAAPRVRRSILRRQARRPQLGGPGAQRECLWNAGSVACAGNARPASDLRAPPARVRPPRRPPPLQRAAPHRPLDMCPPDHPGTDTPPTATVSALHIRPRDLLGGLLQEDEAAA